MTIKQKVQIDSFLRGSKGMLTFRLILSRLCGIMLMFYVISVIYLLVIDTSFIGELRLYDNRYTAMFVCFFAVIIGFVLFMLTVKSVLNYKFSLFSIIDNCKTESIDVNTLIKYSTLRISVIFLKLIYFAVCMMPCALLSLTIFFFMKNGVSVAVLTVLTVCNAVLFFSGLFHCVCMIQKFGLCDYYFAENKNESVTAIIKMSSYLMNGRCEKTAVYKTRHFIFKLLGLFLPVLNVRETAKEILIMTNKIIPYVQSSAHTEKSVVFYVGKTVTS